MLTRREFGLALSAVTAGCLWHCPRVALGQTASLQKRRLREGAWAITGGGGNSLLIDAPGGPVLVDSKIAPVAGEMLDLVTSLVGDGPLTILNTHHHGDHIGGNFRFRQEDPERTVIVAHEKLSYRVTATLEERIRPALLNAAEDSPQAARDAQAARALSEQDFLPLDTFTDEWKLDRGEVQLSMHHHGPGHTDNDGIVHVASHNILHMGDLIFHELHPYIDLVGGADSSAWQGVLVKAESFCDAQTIVIPGHGKLADRGALPAMRNYFEQLRRIVRDAMNAGQSRGRIVDLQPTELHDRGFQHLQGHALGAMYDELAQQS